MVVSVQVFLGWLCLPVLPAQCSEEFLLSVDGGAVELSLQHVAQFNSKQLNCIFYNAFNTVHCHKSVLQKCIHFGY